MQISANNSAINSIRDGVSDNRFPDQNVNDLDIVVDNLIIENLNDIENSPPAGGLNFTFSNKLATSLPKDQNQAKRKKTKTKRKKANEKLEASPINSVEIKTETMEKRAESFQLSNYSDDQNHSIYRDLKKTFQQEAKENKIMEELMPKDKSLKFET